MKRILLLAFISVLWNASSGQDVRLKLDSSAEISIYTCGSGEDLYALFGHTAVRVQDTINGYDRIYNYGTFSFSSDFYVKFTKGQLNYELSAYRFESFEDEYRYDQRFIKQQVLNLTHEQKERMFTFMEINAMPQNKYYLYDFFYDNCSTRPRDVLEEIMQEEILYPEIQGEGPSFREMIDQYLVMSPWADFGIDLGLGAYTDTATDVRGTMFLPEKLFYALEETSFGGRPAVKETKEVFMPEQRELSGDWSDPIPLFFSLLVLFFLIQLWEFRRKKMFHWLDKILFSLLGLLGWFVIFLWFGTDHQATKANLNALWAFLCISLWLFGSFGRSINVGRGSTSFSRRFWH